MKILLTINNIYPVGGAEKALIELSNEMHHRGYDVTILIHKKNLSADKSLHYKLNSEIPIINAFPWIENDNHSRKRKSSINVRNIINKLILLIFSNNNTRFVLKRIVYSLINFSGFNKLLWEKQNCDKITGIGNTVSRLQPDIVISFMPSSFPYVVHALKDSSIPLIIANRNDPYKDYSMDRISFNSYDLKMRIKAPELAAVNLVQIESFRYFFSEAVRLKTFVIPNSVKEVSSRYHVFLQKQNSIKTIISVGRLSNGKNYELLINAFSILSLRYPDWQIKIFGEGYGDEDNKESILRLIQKLNLSEKIILMGITQSISEEYAKSSIFAFSSLFEGFSNALVESMAHGLPSVVIEDCISNKELVTKSNSGLIARNDAKDFAEKLELLMNNPEKRKELGKNGVEFVKKFEPAKIYDIWEELIIKVVNENKKKK